MSYLLLIDTAIQGVAVGLTPLRGERVGGLVWSQVVDSIGDSARLLPVAVDAGLKQCSISSQEVAGIVVTTGPGSFTGLRVGLAYAMGFAAGVEELTRRPMQWLGLSSLAVLAQHHAGALNRSEIFVSLAATKTNGYAACFGESDGKPVLRPLQVSDDLSRYKGFQFISLGEWPLLEAAWPEKGRMLKISPVDACFLTLNCYAEIGLEQWPFGFKGVMPTPEYLRKSTVEEKELQQGQLK